MPLISCPSCGAQYDVPDELIGRKVKCRQCAFKFLTGAGAVVGERTAELTAMPDKPGHAGGGQPPAAGTVAMTKESQTAPGGQSPQMPPGGGMTQAGDDEFAAALAAALEGDEGGGAAGAGAAAAGAGAAAPPQQPPAGGGAPTGESEFDAGFGGTMALDTQAADQVRAAADAAAGAGAAAPPAEPKQPDEFSDMGFGGTMDADYGADVRRMADSDDAGAAAASPRPQAQRPRDESFEAQGYGDSADVRGPQQAAPQPQVVHVPAPGGGKAFMIVGLLCMLVGAGLAAVALLRPQLLEMLGVAPPAPVNNGGTADGSNNPDPSNQPDNTDNDPEPKGPLAGLDELQAVDDDSPLGAIRRYEGYLAQREALMAEFAARNEAMVAAFLHRPAGDTESEAWIRYRESADVLIHLFDRYRSQMAEVEVEPEGDTTSGGDTVTQSARVTRFTFRSELGTPELTTSEARWTYTLKKRAGGGWDIVDRQPAD